MSISPPTDPPTTVETPEGAREPLRWSVERRLAFIEFRLYWEGRVNRADLMRQFGISINQASADLTRYQALAPDNLVYDKRAKHYRASPRFRPLLQAPDAAAYLSQVRLVAEGVAELGESWLPALPPFAAAALPARQIEASVLRALLGAIRRREALHVLYQSMSRPEPLWRWLEPHALAHSGLRWHVRAWCRLDRRFKDFVLARIAAVGPAEPAQSDPAEDLDWHTLVTLEIVPNPGLTQAQQAVVARDYGMTDGRLRLPVRRALLRYSLRRLSLDLDPTQRAPAEQQIVLVRPLYGD